MTRRDAPATRRNREPILEVLARRLRRSSASAGSAAEGAGSVAGAKLRVLEIASGTGQHAVYFATRLSNVVWQPTDLDPESLDSIRAWIADSEEAGSAGATALPITNVLDPVELDVRKSDWKLGEFDAFFSANMLHISPWETAAGLFAGADRHLTRQGQILIYGPFKVGGRQTSESNAAFDTSLKSRDPRWGIRDLEAVAACASDHGFRLVETNDLPANNKLIVFERL